MIIFGPVPSRRLGRSLGINNIIPKHCSYSCVYCQLGITRNLMIERRQFYDPEKIFKEVKEKVLKLKEAREKVDYITFVPDGEPTLDVNLGREIALLKPLGIPIAVITNSSLLSLESVREDLLKADLVSLKVDTVEELSYRKLNRPHHSLNLNAILTGIVEFCNAFRGRILTETMLVNGINDSKENLKNTAAFISGLNPHKSYISIPIRPPAESFALPPCEEILNMAYQIFSEKIKAVEMLVTPEEGEFVSLDSAEDDLLSILSVHPMTEDKVLELLKRRGKSFEIIEQLLSQKKLLRVDYNSKTFYIRKLT